MAKTTKKKTKSSLTESMLSFTRVKPSLPTGKGKGRPKIKVR